MGLLKKYTLLGLALSLVSACALRDIQQQTEIIDDKSTISGTVALAPGHSGPVYVRLYQHHNSHISLVNQIALTTKGAYHFDVVPGRYLVGAYIDKNANQHYDRSEPATYSGHIDDRIDLIDVQKQQQYDRPALIISGPVKKVSAIEQRESLSNVTQNIGKIVS